MLRTALRSLVRAAVLIGAVSSVASGCSRQAEGERCDYTWAGDQDCDSGLTCTRCGLLQDHSTGRCCRPDGTYSDTRCIRTTNPTSEECNTHLDTGTPGAGGTGTAGMSGSGTTAAGGTTGGGTGGTSEETAGTGEPAAGTGG